MKTINQLEIAKKANISGAFLSEIISNKKRPSWKNAKILANITGTTPELWLDGTTKQIRKALKNNGR